MSVPRPDALPAAASSTGARSGTEAAEFVAPATAADSASEGVEPETEAVRSATANHVRRRAGSVTTLLAIAALVAVGGVAFAVGHATGGGTGSTGNTGNQGQFAPNGSFLPGGGPDLGARGAFGASLTGTVVSVTADSITLKLATGATVTIATSGSTTYHSQTAASSSDVAAGNTVTVQTSGSAAGASASPGTQSETQTATDVTITSK